MERRAKGKSAVTSSPAERDSCELCGRAAVSDIGHGRRLCPEHAGNYIAETCDSCATPILRHVSYPQGLCFRCAARTRLEGLPADVRAEIERLVRAREFMLAIRLLHQRDRALGLSGAEELVHLERERLGVALDPPLPSIDVLYSRASALRPLAIEAVWDGDTVHDWFVVLLAITEDPTGGFAEHFLAMCTQTHGPPAERGREIGAALASRLEVPFFFASPERPDDQAPRWWSTR